MVTAAVAEVAVVEVVKFWYNNRFDHPVIICAGNDGMVKAVNIPEFNRGGGGRGGSGGTMRNRADTGEALHNDGPLSGAVRGPDVTRVVLLCWCHRHTPPVTTTDRGWQRWCGAGSGNDSGTW